jgi:NAD(P)-dependent dehydrogenase (short-subunit alcohol dehydrogenase family)
MGKSILITGCSSGIGHHCATKLHQRGYRVFATARKSEDVAALTALGLNALQLDLNDSASINDAVKYVLNETGGDLYALFNNGAYGQPGAVEDLTRGVLRKQFETNVFGWLELTNLLIPQMRKHNRGRIIQNSSVLGLVAMPFRGAYNASKFAIEGLTDTLRIELMDSDIQVTLIEPGPIESQFRANALAALKENIDMDKSHFKADYKDSIGRLDAKASNNKFCLQPEAVYVKLIHALEAKRAKPRYYVTFPTHLFAFLRRVLPVTWLDKILARAAS